MNQKYLFITLLFSFMMSSRLMASHSMGGQLTYHCLGNNTYQLTYTLYRDCSGILPLPTMDVVYYSSCYPNGYIVTLNQSGNPIQISPSCPTAVTTCNGGIYTGIEEYTYTATVTLPGACADWTFYHDECCRNAAITTIQNPANQTQVIYSFLNNTNGVCDDSPIFTNPPVPFACVGQPFCFNQGGYDPNGDSLVYSLAEPLTDDALGLNFIGVTYVGGLSYTNPVPASVGATINPMNGDFCVTPNATGVTVFSVLIDEYRNGVYIGTVERDIQLTIQNCTNNLPSLTGINGGASFSTSTCANQPVCFWIKSNDPDAVDSTTLTWDFSIPGATFTPAGSKRDSARFCWTPTTADIDPSPHCFTITVQDNHCPYRGTQSLAYCITVNGVTATTTSTNLICNGATNGSVAVTATGSPTYSYAWSPSGGPGATSNNLGAGTYNVTVTGSNGCTATTTATISQPTPVTANITPTQPSCGSTNGSATVLAGGGTGPYTYLWSPSGGTGATASNLGSGNFSVVVTDSHGCTKSSNVTLAAPSSPVAYISGITNSTCLTPTGNITASATGGTGPFTYSWSPSGGNAATASNLQPGSYTCTITGSNGCSSSATGTISSPSTVIASISNSTPVSCSNMLNGTATASQSGGTAGYTYVWSPSGGNSATASGLGAGLYTVTITDATGCTSSASTTITAPPAINASINSTPVLCNGSASGSLTVAASGGSGTLSYLWSPSGGSNATANNLIPGAYTVTVTDANGCTNTASSTLANPPLLTNTISSTGSICGQATGTATIVPSGGTAPYSYVWTPAAINSASITNLISGQYSVVITDANNCTTTATVAVAALPGPVVSLTSQTDVICNGGNNGSATVQVAGGTTPLTYSWSPSGGNAASASTLSAGNYSVIVTDANGCTSTTQVTIAQPTPVTVAIASTTNSTCFGSNDGSISVNASGGTPTYNYTWTPTSANAASLSNLSAGNYSVVVTDLNGCTNTISTTLTQPALLTAAINSTPVLCNGSASGSLTVAASGGSGTFTYLWSPSGGSGATANNLSAGTYSVTVTDGNGCTSTSSSTLSDPTLLTNSISSLGSICGQATGSATVVPSGGTAPYTYAWTPAATNSASINNLISGQYSVVITDANNCTSTATVAVPIIPGPVASLSAQTDVSCNGGNNGSATVQVAGGTSPLTYSWTPSGGNATSASSLSAGNYSVIVTDANGCTSTTQVTIAQPTPVTVAIASSTNLTCFGSNDGSVSINASGGTPTYSYTWTPASTNSASLSNLSSGNYSVVVTDLNGCTNTISTTLSQPPLLTAAVNSTPVLCNGGNSGSASVIANGGTANYSYIWSPSGGNASSASNLSAGSYTVIITDNNGCTATANTTVTQPALLTSVISASTDVACFGGNNGSATVSVNGGTTNYTYQWTPSGGTGVNAQNLSSGNYSVVATDANGCTTTTQVTINQPTLLTVSSTSTPVNCFGGADGSTNSVVNGGVANYSYNWSPGNLLSPSANGLSAGNYTVTVTDANGCTTSSSTSVTQPTQLALTVGSTPVLCNGGANGSTSANVSGGTAAYSYSWFPSGGTNPTATNLNAGNYSVTITDANGCTTASAVTVSQPTAIVLSTSSTPATCGAGNGSASVNANGGAGGNNYLWAPSGGNGLTASNLAAGAYTVTVTDLNGCTASATANVSNIGGPTINAFATSNVSCFNGNNGTAGSNVANGTGPFTYSWTPSGGSNSTATNLSAGNYSVSVTDANGCTSVANFIITEPTALAAQAASNPSSCFGSSNGSTSVNVAGGTAGYSYLWTPGGAVTSNPTGLSAGNYSVVITDANGCTISANTTVSQPTALVVSANSSPTLCFNGTDGSATANVSGGTAGYTYSWFPSGGNSVTASNLNAGNYSVTITDANGCTESATTTVNQPAAIVLNTSTNPSTCGSSNGSANVNVIGGATPFTYSWSPSGGNASTANNIPSNSYTVTVTDANGCTQTASANVSSLGGPTITASLMNDVSCFGGNNGSATSNVSLGNGPFTYSWSPSGGNAATASNLSAGVYSVSVTDINGCTSVANVNITQPVAMVAQASSAPALCFGGASGSASVNVAGGVVGYSYIWVPGNSSSANPAGLTAGNYTVTVTDANGCTTTAATTVNQPTQLSLSVTPVAVLCNGGTNGSAQAIVSGGTSGYTYSWFPSGGASANAINLGSGSYSVTITDANGCTKSSSTVIQQPAAMNLSTSSVPATCGSSNGSATVNVSGGATPYSYSWSPGGGISATFSNLSANTYSVIITDANGCTSSTSESVSNSGGPTIATNVGTNVSCHGQNDGSASVTVSAGTAPFNYLWSPSGGNGQNATNLPAGNYSITVTDANGCISNDNIVIIEPSALLTQISSTDANCAGIGGSATVTAVGGTTPYSYSWTGSGSVTATATGLTGGNYTATVTDSHGCTSAISSTVNQPGGIVSVINSNPVSCNGGSNGSASVIANGGSGALSYSWSPSGGNSSSANNLTAGNYSVTISDAGGCVSTASVIVAQPNAIALNSSTTPSACGAANGSANVIAAGGLSPYQYNWSPTGGNAATASNLTAGNYTVTVTDANGCTSSNSTLVTNTGGPTVTLNTLSNVNCNGDSNGSASVNVAGGNGPFTYSWSPYGGSASSASNLSAGTFTVNTSDANGCQTAINIVINEPTALSSQSSSSPAVCGNANGSASIVGNGGVGNYLYTWSGFATHDSTLSNVISGHYSVTITDGNGCSTTATINVGTSSGANAILQSSTDVSCNGGSNGSATISVSGGNAPYSYAWSPAGGNNATASGLSAGNYIVTVSDANNCTSTINVVINDGAILILQTSSTPASCNGGTNGSASVVVNGGNAPYTYQWTGSSSASSTANNLGIGNYTVTVTDANGCAEAEIATVNSATPIALNPVSTDLNCNGTHNGTANVTPAGGTPPYTYQWTGNVSTTNSATNLSGGFYSLTVTDANGCASIANFNINEPDPILLSVSPSQTICIGQSSTLVASVSGGSLPYVYSWSSGANTDSIQISPTTSTAYTVSVVDANGCSAGTQNIDISVNPPLNINANAPAGICSGENVQLSSIASGGNGNYTYSWNNGEFNTANAIANPTTDATYTVVVTDNCGTPPASAVVNVIVSPDPIVDFGPGLVHGCSPLTVNFDDQSNTLPGSTFNWNFGDNQTSTTQNPSHTFVTPGSYNVGLVVMNSYGCSSSLVITDMINVYASPTAAFTSQPTATTVLEPDVVFTNTSNGGNLYTWDFGDGSSFNHDVNPQHTYTDTGTYLITLVTISNNGCIDTVRGYIEIDDAFTIYIPNAFTPNSDAVNDHFNAYGIGWTDYNLYILDRWGLNIYHSTDHEKPWDGTYEGNGQECQADTYVYKIMVHDTKGKLHSFIGHVSLVR